MYQINNSKKYNLKMTTDHRKSKMKLVNQIDLSSIASNSKNDVYRTSMIKQSKIEDRKIQKEVMHH